jgi:hypothetical protein
MAKRVTHIVCQEVEQDFETSTFEDLPINSSDKSTVSDATRRAKCVRTHVLLRRFFNSSSGLIKSSTCALNQDETERNHGEGSGAKCVVCYQQVGHGEHKFRQGQCVRYDDVGVVLLKKSRGTDAVARPQSKRCFVGVQSQSATASDRTC